MNKKKIDEIFISKNKIPKIKIIDNKISRICKEKIMFNPLITKRNFKNLFTHDNIKYHLTPNTKFFFTTTSTNVTEENLKNKLNESNEKTNKRNSMLIETEGTREKYDENVDASLLDIFDSNRAKSSLNFTDHYAIRLPNLNEKLVTTNKERIDLRLIRKRLSKNKLSMNSLKINLNKESKNEKFSYYSGNYCNTQANSYLKNPISITIENVFESIYDLIKLVI